MIEKFILLALSFFMMLDFVGNDLQGIVISEERTLALNIYIQNEIYFQHYLH